jgi:DNA-3-methyladenine glycosylase I
MKGGAVFQRQPWMQRAGEYPADDLAYHELLARAVFSGGLGPRVVEARWAGMREAFAAFDPAAVGTMDESTVSRLLADPKIIRNRRKIEAVIKNAAEFSGIVTEWGSFHSYLGSLRVTDDLPGAAATLAERFTHLGPTSAALFLFSAGWRASAESLGESATESGSESASGPDVEPAAGSLAPSPA